jgi:hypothetical protein
MSSVVREPVKSWSRKALKTNKVPYPICKDGGDAPKFFWLSIWCAPRGHGKTYGLCKLLKHYEQHGITTHDGSTKLPQRIILFSPTFEANPIFRNLKWLDKDDVHAEYSDEKLASVIADIEYERMETDAYHKQMALYDKFKQAKSIEDLTDEDLLEIEKLGFMPPIKPKYLAHPVNYIIFDDLLGSHALRGGRSPLVNVAIRNRHIAGGLNIAILVQGMKQVPKVVRSNASLYVIGRFLNKKSILEDLYEEVSGCVTEADFEKIYDDCTAHEHGNMVIDMSQAKEKRFSRNFEEVVRLC